MRRPIALFLLLTLPAQAELAPEEWKRVRHDAAQLAARAGEGDAKLTLIAKIAEEDSARAARLLVEFAAASVDRRRRLAPRLDDTNTAAREDCGGQAARALEDALDLLEARFGQPLDRLRWGAAHVAHFPHPADVMISSAEMTFSGFDEPPISRKLAGSPP